MSDSKLSDLTAATSVAPADLAYVVQGGTSKKATREILQTYDAGTLTTDKKVLDLSATWNAAGVTFTGVKFNVTNTASASGSKVFDFQIGGTTQLALTATGLGVGTGTPSYKLDVVSTGRIKASGAGNAQFVLESTSGVAALDLQTDAGLNRIIGGLGGTSNLGFYTASTEKMRLDASGNLGLGVTPSAWSSAWKALQVGARTFIAQGSASDTLVGYNWYQDTNGTNRYIASAGANVYIIDGAHKWLTAPSGTAGNAISFTERLQITNGGLLTFGGTTSSFPALKRSSTTLQVRLADDSGDAPFSSGKATIQTLTVGLGGATSVATNTAVGFESLNSASLTGTHNVGVGYRALLANTSGQHNSALGTFALYSNTSGRENAAVGYSSLEQNTSGNGNSAFGWAALISNTTAGSNSGFGFGSLRYFNTSNNVAVGFEAVRGSTTVANNTGNQLVGVGYQALFNNTSGGTNSAVGSGALFSNTTASNNSALGTYALYYFNTSNNVAVGFEAVKGSTTVANNTGSLLTGVGYQALLNNTSGDNNTAVGYQALVNNTTGSNNAAVGLYSLLNNSTASSNSALGVSSLRYFNTANNTAVGFGAIQGSSTVANNTGSNLTAVGYQALYVNTSGTNNAAFGSFALNSNSTGSNNTAVGRDALFYFNTSNNVAIGSGALVGGSTTVANNTGANNIGIGYQAGDAITSGSTNIAIGYQVDVDSATGSSQINIGDRYFHDRIRLLERTSDPAKPAEGNMIVWMSDGTGLGDDGDVIIASTAGGVTNYAILFDHSAGTVWP